MRMMSWRIIFVAILSCSLLQTPLSGASSSALGAIVYADRAYLGAASASAGATIFSGDKLRTEPAGNLQIRIEGGKWVLISFAIIVPVWAVHEALESPDRP